MTGNIIGEPIDGYVQTQIALRQFSQFSGYDYSRTSPEFQYLTNRNAWVKLASSVEITNAGLRKLTNINIENANNFLGTGLAKKAILFNTLSEYTNSSSPLTSKRAGITNTNTLWNDDFAYGIGGKNFGLQPPPGIIGVTVDSLNRGSIRKANINLKAHNRFQFDIIELLYLRLGFTMMLEWGWDKYLSLNKEGTVSLNDTGNTIIEEKWFESTGYNQISMLNLIQSYRKNYSGNYDGFFGKVSNFTWNYNSDGTYDIAIDLITIGDVIESLKVNTSSKIVASTTGEVESPTEPQEAANNITQASYLNTVGYFLYKKAFEIGTAVPPNSSVEFGAKSNTNLFFLPGKLVDSFIKDGQHNYLAINPSRKYGERTNAKGNQSIQFYIRLKEFFSQLESLVIPIIDNNLQLTFELNSCLMTHFPNQISLDPKVCVFKYPLGYGDIIDGGGGEGVYNPASIDARISPAYLSKLADYQVKKGDYIYGDLMNIYINFEYISGLLLQNGGPDQDLSLFKFLQDLCNGINNALGGVNKLEPIIKDDYIITIIDQTFSSAANNSVDLNVYGYNPDTQTSNFVKDIKFVSKITPGLASTITIGATAGGSSTSEIDGTAFSKWSEGLVDRFSRNVAEPTGVKTLEIQSTEEKEALQEKKYEDEWNELPDVDIVKEDIQDIFAAVVGGGISTFNFSLGVAAAGALSSTPEERKEASKNLNKIVPPGNKYTKLIAKPGGVSLEEYKREAREQDEKERRRNIVEVEDLQDLVCTDYYFYLINAFGGRSNNYQVPFRNKANRGEVISRPYEKSIDNARYLEYNDTFISQGKAAYKNYLNMLNNRRYGETNTPSSEIGFIPLSFDVTLDGISGVKIYNKLNINNNFLPSNYPESLKFVITKVNHSISNNSWETSLSTVSIPQTSEYKFGEFVTIPTLTNTGGSGEGSSLPGVVDGVPKVTLGPGGYSVETTNLASKWKNKVIYVPEETKKTMLVLHHTAGNQAGKEGVIRDVTLGTWKKVDFPLATHYVIQDGITEQIFDEKYWSYHCGWNDEVNKRSLSVELGAYGCLILRDGKYWAEANTNFTTTTIPENQVARTVDKCGNPSPYRGYEYMHKYTPYQITKLENLIIGWRTKHKGVKWEFNYDEMFPGMGLPNQDKGKFRILSENAKAAIPGVYSHNSTEQYKIDVMPQLELIQMLRRVLDNATPGMNKCPRNSPSIEK